MRLCVASVIGKIKTKEFLGKLWRKYLSVGVKAEALTSCKVNLSTRRDLLGGESEAGERQ